MMVSSIGQRVLVFSRAERRTEEEQSVVIGRGLGIDRSSPSRRQVACVGGRTNLNSVSAYLGIEPLKSKGIPTQ